jgi:DNA-binding transcriptional ArsR family regulator
VHNRFDVTVCEPALVFLPSVFAGHAQSVVDPVVRSGVPASPESAGRPVRPNPHRRPAMLFYPVAGRALGAAPEPARRDELIGRTRARILAAVADPATTGEVAGRLRLSPSTVSYHLQILHRAGLVRRTRDVRSVLYQSTRAAG